MTGTLGQKFNGNAGFLPADVGRYLVTYYWSINDGRYLTATKGVTVRSTPANVTISVEDEDGNSVSTACGTDAYSGDIPPATITGTNAGDTDTAPLSQFAGVSWTKGAGVEIISLTATLYDAYMIPHTVTIANPTVGSTVMIPMRYYIDDVDGDGNAVTYSTEINQTYTIAKSGDVYSLVFNKRGTQAEPQSINGLSYDLADTQADAEVVLVIRWTTATVRVKKVITNYAASLADHLFPITLESAGNVNGQAFLKHGETSKDMTVVVASASLDIDVSETVPMEFDENYTVTITNADGSTATVNGRTVTIHPGDNVTIVVNNTFTHKGFFKAWDWVTNLFG